MRGASHPVGAAIIIAMWSGYPVSTGLQMASGSRRPTAPGWPLLLLSTGLDRVHERLRIDRYQRILKFTGGPTVRETLGHARSAGTHRDHGPHKPDSRRRFD